MHTYGDASRYPAPLPKSAKVLALSMVLLLLVPAVIVTVGVVCYSPGCQSIRSVRPLPPGYVLETNLVGDYRWFIDREGFQGWGRSVWDSSRDVFPSRRAVVANAWYHFEQNKRLEEENNLQHKKDSWSLAEKSKDTNTVAVEAEDQSQRP